MIPFPYYSPKAIREILTQERASPKKSWGQNYLIDKNTIDSLFDDIQYKVPANTKSLAEIGIGLGALTHKILGMNLPVDLFEIDPISIRIFREGIGKYFINWAIWEGDCRHHLTNLNGKSCFLFGNLPYYITTEIIVDSLKSIRDMTGFIFMVQKEFAIRVTSEISSLSLFITAFGRLERFKSVRKTCFYPPPKIDSEFLFFLSEPLKGICIDRLERMLRIVFWGKRKRISTSIREAPNSLFKLENSVEFRDELLRIFSINNWESKRPEEISFQDWKIIIQEFAKKN